MTYVSTLHRDDPGRGCAVPTLGAEIARESAKTRKAFGAKLEQMIEVMAEQIPDLPRKTARKQAMGTLATMMGTLVLSRVAGSRRTVGRNSRALALGWLDAKGPASTTGASKPVAAEG